MSGSAVPKDMVMTIITWLLLQFSGVILTACVSSKSINYTLMKNGIIPTSGMTAVGPAFNGSVIRCAAECDRFSSKCTSFIIQMSPCWQQTPIGIGRCQLLSVTDPDDVVLNPTTDCQRFYLANLCSRDISNPCMNSGTCNMTRWPNICTCPIGYGGTYCEIGMQMHLCFHRCCLR